MEPSTYVGDPVFRRIESKDFTKTYYINTEVLNAGDHVLVDVHDPNSRGFGGSKFKIKTIDNCEDFVKGPWHGTCPYDVFNTSELHFTQVTILANAEYIEYDVWAALEQQGMFVPIPRMRGNVLYDEPEKVLGSFYRGDRIAQQLADLRNETLFVHIETAGGGHSRYCKPSDKLHPLAHRRREV